MRYDGRHRVGAVLAGALVEAARRSVGHSAKAAALIVPALCEDIDQMRIRIRALDKTLETMLEGHEVARLLRTIPGLGAQTVARLLGEVGDPARFGSGEALSSYVGVVPGTASSGKHQPRSASISPIGNARLRRALWMPTLSAVRKNPWLRAFYERAAGKKPKVALVVAMNKLLRAVWSVAHNRRPFELRGQGRFFQGYYGHYCYMPLYVFCCDFLLLARLRTADVDPAKGAEVELARIVGQIRERWPSVHIIVRGDAGFAREALMAWCERNDVDYVFGLAKNRRLQAAIASQMEHARRKCLTRKKPARAFRSFFYRTRESWSRARRVIGKAEHTLGGANPRFIVTSLPPTRCSPALLYEGLYCERGDMENRIKEQQLELFADRTSTATLRANQLQLWLSSVAYLLLTHLRRVGLRGTELAAAQVGTIRNRLLEIGAVVAVSVRRVFIQLSSAFPLQATFVQILENLRSLRPRWE